MRRPIPPVILAVLVVLLAGCRATGGGATAEAGGDADTTAVEAAETDAGTSLVGPDGMTLYVFTQDTDGTSTCADACAETWPPFEVPAGTELEAGEGVTGELATIERDDGATQVTYDGMPLYFYAEDAEPGDATGEGVGDVWFIASPEGGSGAEPSEDAEATDDGAGGGDDDTPTDYDYGY